jgi:tetratricopeptide (TPR) repeat protein
MERIEALMASGDVRAVERLALAELRTHSDDPHLYFYLGRCSFYDIDRLGEGTIAARKYFMRAVELDPGMGEYYYALADLENLDGHWDKALEYCNKSITCARPDKDIYELRAAVYANLKRYQLALDDIDKFLAGRPQERREGLEKKASILENMGKFAAALCIYQELDGNKPQDQYEFAQVRCFDHLGRLDDALKVLGQLIKRHPEDELAYLARARINAKQGKYNQAIADYTKTIDEAPASAIYRERAEVYKKLNKLDLYKKDIETADKM